MADKIKILFEKFIAGNCTREEFDMLMELLHDNAHESAVRDMMQSVYQQIEQSLISDTYITGTGDIKTRSGHTGPRILSVKRIVKISAVAASVLLLFFIGRIWFKPKENAANNSTRYVNAEVKTSPVPAATTMIKHIAFRGEQKHIILSDGTQVWLNSESTLEVPSKFDDKKRVVYLTGEAFFDVKHADKVPFIIHTPNNVSTRVLGTAFEIKAYAHQDVSVSVKRGKVQVSKNDKVLAILTVGKKITVPENATSRVADVKENLIAGWTQGRLEYNAMKLKDILDDLQRIYNITVQLDDKSLNEEVITISFNQEDGADAVLQTLCTLTNKKYTVKDGIYIIR